TGAWYNPAGLAKAEQEITIEFSAIPGRRAFDNYSNDFDRIKYGIEYDYSGETDYGGFLGYTTSGFAAYIGRIYTLDMYRPITGNTKVGDTVGRFKETINLVGLAYGRAIDKEGKFKLGISLEVVTYVTRDMNVWYFHREEDGINYAVPVDELENEFGGSGSVGFLFELVDKPEQSLNITLGGVYRFRSSGFKSEEDSGSEYIFLDQMVLTKPKSMAFGAAITKSTFTLALQYSSTDWSTTNEYIDNRYDTFSIGGEYLLGSESLAIALRAGYFSSNTAKENEYWPDMNGITGGIGLLFSEKLGLDITIENRTFSFPDNPGKKNTHISVGVVYIFSEDD
ncbi:MAG: hypothetical protein V2I33_22245, partial [Kangiellaceae bacterium]|nr:hypothetical protein [Kangiellaceae bacterium]